MRGIILVVVFASLLPFVFGKDKLFGFFTKGPFFGVLMWFWFALMYPQFLVYGPFRAIRYSEIIAIVTLLSWLISNDEKALPGKRLTILILLLMTWISITSMLGSGPWDQVAFYWEGMEKMLLMTLVAYSLTSTRERLDQLIIVCALSIGFYGAKIGLYQILKGGSGRIQGPGGLIADNNDLGLVMTMFLPLMIYVKQRYSVTPFNRPLQGIIVLTVIAALFTYSRGALLGISAMLGIAWFRSRHKILSAALIVAAVGGVFAFAPQKWFARMDTISSYQKDDSAEKRLYMWRLAWAMALKHPIVGGGFRWSYAPDTVNREFAGSDFHYPIDDPAHELPPLTSPTAIHSNWFEMLSSHGFPGLGLFVAFGLTMLLDARWLVRHTRDRPDLDWANNLGRMLQASLAGYWVAGSFLSLYYYDGFYVVVMIAAVARRLVAAELAQPVAAPSDWRPSARPQTKAVAGGGGLPEGGRLDVAAESANHGRDPRVDR